MKKIKFTGLFIITICLMFSVSIASGHEKSHKAVKKGILLVAFGTSIEKAQKSFDNIEQKVRIVYPKIPIKWAYTSHIIRKKLAKQGKIYDSVCVALSKMLDDGFTHVAVQSLHTIPGEEYHKFIKDVTSFRSMSDTFERIVPAYPLLSTTQDIEKVTRALMANIPKKRKKDEAFILMGHGTHHPANVYYAALNYHLQLKDPNIMVGTVEGYPGIDDVIDFLKKKKIKKVWLAPFMSVAGDHAINDLAGDEEDSWKSILRKHGFKCGIILKGTAEYDNIVSVWIDHLIKAVKHLPKE